MQSEPSLAGAGPVGVLSPHLDDAALSCGQLLINRPGSHVVTAFSDGPVVKKVPSWETASGMFKPGDDLMEVRRREDVEALAFAQAHAHHLGFWDLQFRPPLSVPLGRLRPAARTARKEAEKSRLVSEVATRLQPLIETLGVTTWLVPLGLRHFDHQITAAAGARLAAHMTERTWVVYAELPHSMRLPEDIEAALDNLVAQGFSVEPLVVGDTPVVPRKRELLGYYRSQLTPLGAAVERAATGPEKYFTLSRLP